MKDDSFVKIAKALADPTRRQILTELRACGETRFTCSCMCAKFPLSQPTISHHIRTLEEAGLIHVEKDGQFHVLSVNEDVLHEFASELTGGATAKKKTRRHRANATRA
jgi:DNA-binding transcriptional ArsR family regulator